MILIYDEETAKLTQLMLEYFQKPPFTVGTPTTVWEEVITLLMRAGQPLVDAFWRQPRETDVSYRSD